IGQSNFNSSFSSNSGQEYSVTFWAKASARRMIQPVMTTTAGYYGQPVPITTDWRQYQATLYPTSSGTAFSIDFCLGNTNGVVWLDDVQVQAGSNNYYRRDFDRGIVLVNPNLTAQTIQLEKPYKKILGTVSPEINDGSVVGSVTLAGTQFSNAVGDAIFLLN